MRRKWHKGPPPHVGWWNASVNRDPESWRWWDGLEWSMAAFPEDEERVAAREAFAKTTTNSLIEWTTYWPKNARVPRIKP